MLATEVTENTEVYSFVGAALAANNPSDHDEFAAKAAPFTVIQIRTTKQASPSVPLWQNIYRINPPSLIKTPIYCCPRLFFGTAL